MTALMSKGKVFRRFVETGKLSKHTFDTLFNIDPSPKKKYLAWMCKAFLVMPDMSKFNVITSFYDLTERDQIKEKDIYRYKSIEEIDDVVRTVAHVLTKSEIKRGIKDIEDIPAEDIVFENDKAIVLFPQNKEKSCMYGKGSNWCTAATGGSNYFNSYFFSQGVNLYYIIPKMNMSKIVKKYKAELEKVMRERSSYARNERNILEKIEHNLDKIAVAVYPLPQNRREYYLTDDSPIKEELFTKIVAELELPFEV